MKVKPRLLDLFCGAGGAAMGYASAGFGGIVGVDILPQKRYPFEFVQGDALEFVKAHGRDFDFIHASPPCKGYSSLKFLRDLRHEPLPASAYLIEPTRAALRAVGRPYIIENVTGAPLWPAVRLCGSYFGLKVRRHRLFEADFLLLGVPCRHDVQGRPVGVYGHARSRGFRGGTCWPKGSVARTVPEARARPWGSTLR